MDDFLKEMPDKFASNKNMSCVSYTYGRCRKNELYEMIDKCKDGDNTLLVMLQEKFPELGIKDIEVVSCGQHYDSEPPPKRRKYPTGIYYMYFNIFYELPSIKM